MMAPRYQDIGSKSVPEVSVSSFATARILAGEAGGVRGPVENVVMAPTYLEITLQSGKEFERNVEEGHTVFLYIIDGSLGVGADAHVVFNKGSVVLFEREGNKIHVQAGTTSTRFLLIAGKPIGEPVAWRGPIVMNTHEELNSAFRELQEGNFLKHSVGA